MAKIIRRKFSFDNPEMMDEGVVLCVEAYREYKQKHIRKIEALQDARNRYVKKYGKLMPDNYSMVEYLTKIETLLESGDSIQAKGSRQSKDFIINTTVAKLRQIGYGKQVKQEQMVLETEEEKEEKIQEEKPIIQKTEQIDPINILINEIVMIIRNGITITIKPLSDN